MKKKKSTKKAVVSSSKKSVKLRWWMIVLALLPLAIIGSYFAYDKYKTNDLKAKAGDLNVLPIFDDNNGSSIVACKKYYGSTLKTTFIYAKPVGQTNTESHLQGVETKTGVQWWGDEVNAMEVEVPSSGYLNIGMSRNGVRYINESVPLRGIPQCFWD